jgi:hypothetical protein
LPAEKTFGIAKLYDYFMNQSENYGFNTSDAEYVNYVQRTLGIPSLPVAMRWKYYTLSYYRAIMKRVKKFKLVPKSKPALAH